MCSGLIVWLVQNVSDVPSGLVRRHSIGDPGARSCRPDDADAVVLADDVVDLGFVEGERQHALLLQVRLMDAGEAANQDGLAAPEPWFHRSVLTRGALAPVLVADGDPGLAGLVVVTGDLGVRLGRAVEHVLALADLAGEGVDRPQEQVARDVLQVSPVLQPGPGHGDVVGGALALGLDQDRQVHDVLAVPRGERLEQLQPVRGGGDLHLHRAAILGGCHEGVLARGESQLRELHTDRFGESDLLAVRRW